MHLRSLAPCQLSCAMLLTAASMTANEMVWLRALAAPVAAMPRKPASNRGQHQLPTAHNNSTSHARASPLQSCGDARWRQHIVLALRGGLMRSLGLP